MTRKAKSITKKEITMKKTTIILGLVMALVLAVGWTTVAGRSSEQGILEIPSTGVRDGSNSAVVDQNPDIRAHAVAFYELFELNSSISADQNPDIRAIRAEELNFSRSES
jgi:hypothetical protein